MVVSGQNEPSLMRTIASGDAIRTGRPPLLLAGGQRPRQVRAAFAEALVRGPRNSRDLAVDNRGRHGGARHRTERENESIKRAEWLKRGEKGHKV